MNRSALHRQISVTRRAARHRGLRTLVTSAALLLCASLIASNSLSLLHFHGADVAITDSMHALAGPATPHSLGALGADPQPSSSAAHPGDPGRAPDQEPADAAECPLCHLGRRGDLELAIQPAPLTAAAAMVTPVAAAPAPLPASHPLAHGPSGPRAPPTHSA